MRAHLPVVTNDYVLNDGDIIVTKPDLKGKLTYVNHGFLKISRRAVQESIGAPPSLMRHPDMPQDTFGDVWRSPKSGKSWNGGGAHRRKNGECYCGEATVTVHGQE